MRTTIIALGSILLALAVIYFVFRDNLPPRTPHKVARLVSHLSIPNNAVIIEFQDQWNEFNGDGFSFIVLQLSDEAFRGLYQEAKDKGYKKLPVIEDIYGPLKEMSEETTEGIYIVNIDEEAGMSFEAAMLSQDDKRVMIYIASN